MSLGIGVQSQWLFYR